MASTSSISARLKFETPMLRARPRSWACSIPGQAQVGPFWGQCTM